MISGRTIHFKLPVVIVESDATSFTELEANAKVEEENKKIDLTQAIDKRERFYILRLPNAPIDQHFHVAVKCIKEGGESERCWVHVEDDFFKNIGIEKIKERRNSATTLETFKNRGLTGKVNTLLRDEDSPEYEFVQASLKELFDLQEQSLRRGRQISYLEKKLGVEKLPLLFSLKIENNIRTLFDEDLLDSVKALNQLFPDRTEIERHVPDGEVTAEAEKPPQGAQEFQALLDALKKTPDAKNAAIDIKKNPVIKEIKAAASALEKAVELTNDERLKKYAYRITGAITLAVPSVYAGIQAGVYVGLLSGGAFFSVPNAIVGGIVGGVMGTIGFWAGDKLGNYLSPTRAKAAHAATIKEATQMIEEEKSISTRRWSLVPARQSVRAG